LVDASYVAQRLVQVHTRNQASVAAPKRLESEGRDSNEARSGPKGQPVFGHQRLRAQKSAY